MMQPLQWQHDVQKTQKMTERVVCFRLKQCQLDIIGHMMTCCGPDIACAPLIKVIIGTLEQLRK